jgi:hypothetical protein
LLVILLNICISPRRKEKAFDKNLLICFFFNLMIKHRLEF